MGKGISLHPEFGVNPTVCMCFWCGEDTGAIALLGNNGGREAPPRSLIDYDPCDKCKAIWEQGILLIETQDTPLLPKQFSMKDGGNIYPTGRWLVFKRESLSKILDETTELFKQVSKEGRAHITQQTFDVLCPEEEATRGLADMPVGGHA